MGGSSAQSPTPDSTPTAEPTPAVEPTAEPTETIDHPYDISEPHITFGTFESELFDGEVEGYKFQSGDSKGYNIFSADKERIFEYSELDHRYDQQLVMNLQPEQYSELMDKYGVIDNLVMETDYEKGLVAIRYEGSEGVLEFETEFIKGATIEGYIRHNM